MVIKVYISGICGSQEVRKHQQRVLFILQGLNVDLQIIDVTEPGRDEDLTFMQETAKKHGKETQLPPQIFNENEYCGDYAAFELANDDDDIMKFLKLESGPLKAEILQSGGTIESITQNGIGNHENNTENPETQEINNTEGIVNAGNDTVAEDNNADEKSAVASEEISHVTEETEQKNSESEENKDKVPPEAEESEEEESD